MRKIKSVKLAKEFNNGVIEAGINTLVIFFQKQDRYYIDDTGFDYPFTDNTFYAIFAPAPVFFAGPLY